MTFIFGAYLWVLKYYISTHRKKILLIDYKDIFTSLMMETDTNIYVQLRHNYAIIKAQSLFPNIRTNKW